MRKIYDFGVLPSNYVLPNAYEIGTPPIYVCTRFFDFATLPHNLYRCIGIRNCDIALHFFYEHDPEIWDSPIIPVRHIVLWDITAYSLYMRAGIGNLGHSRVNPSDI